jgi:hypothetical protein
LTFTLSGGAAKVTATITGYSTQVTDGDVSGLDGTSGQVLTDNGTGAAWQTLPAKTAYVSTTTTPPVAITTSPTPVNSLTVPAGTYVVSDTYDVLSGVPDLITCSLAAPDGPFAPTSYANSNGVNGSGYVGAGSTQMVLTTTGGAITLKCEGATQVSGDYVANNVLIASEVDTGSGSVVH